jgi:ParB family transcriptional regulator, chromosome partitioning protein
MPKTFAVPYLVVHPAAATETSLAENIIRLAMHPADQFIAFHALVVQSGLSIDDVAARLRCFSSLGSATLTARQRSPSLHQNLSSLGESASTGSKPLPSPTTSRPGKGLGQVASRLGTKPHNLRSPLTENTSALPDRRARFVRLDVYVAAGGTLERDLFNAMLATSAIQADAPPRLSSRRGSSRCFLSDTW